MSFVLKNDSIHYSGIERNSIAHAAVLDSLDGAENSGISYGVSEPGEKPMPVAKPRRSSCWKWCAACAGGLPAARKRC